MSNINTEDIDCDQKNTTMLKALTWALYNYLKTGISSSVFLFWLSRQGLTMLPRLVLNLWKSSCLRLPSERFIVAHTMLFCFSDVNAIKSMTCGSQIQCILTACYMGALHSSHTFSFFSSFSGFLQQ